MVPKLNLRAYGAAGDGSTNDTVAFINACQSAENAGGGTVIVPPGTYKLSTSYTVASTVTLRFEQGGQLSIDSGVTLTINGRLEAGLYQIFSGAGTVTFGSGAVDRALPHWFGAAVNGSTDDTTALNNCFASYYRVRLPKGRYAHTAALSFIRSDIVDIEADPGAVLVGSGSGYDSLRTGGLAANFDPTSYGSVTITGNPSAGDESITVTGLNASAGDILRLTSSDNWASTARAGELIEVLSVSGDVYQLTRPLADSYTGANTNVLIVTAPTVRISNLTIERTSNDQGLVIKGARNLDLDSVRVTGARYAGIVAQFVYGGEIHNCSTRDMWYSGTGTSYGLEIATSYDVDIHSNRFYGGRHALSLANYEPNRFITIRGNTIANRDEESDGALNIHNGAEHCIVDGNFLDGGFEVAAVNLRFTNNRVRGKTPNGTSTGVFSVVRNSDYLIIEGNTIDEATAAGGPSPCYLRASADNVTHKWIRIAGNVVTGVVSLAQGGIWISPISSAGGANFAINSLDLIDNEVRLGAGGSSQAYAALVNDNGKGDTFYPIITRANLRGGFYKNPSGRAVAFINQNTGAKNDEIRVREADIEGTSQAVYCDGAAVLSVKDSRVAGGGTIYVTNVTELTEIVDNRIYNAASRSGIDAGSGNTGESIVSNYYIDCKGTISTSLAGWGRVGGEEAGPQNTVTRGATLPSTGTWRQGDVRWKSDVAAAGSPGWVCVTSGTYSSFSDTTGDTTNGSAVITGMTSTSGLNVGDYVTVSAGFALSVIRVESIDSATQITLAENATSTQANVTVSTPDPVWKTMAAVAA